MKRVAKTRSAVVAVAVERRLQAEELGADDKAYVEGYLRKPERTADTSDVAGAVTAGWEPW